jgi:hypothetical protein
MKRCPTCNRTYPDDTLAFCLVDGSVLSAPYDPEATQRVPPPRNTVPAATEILNAQITPRELKPLPLSTIRAPAPQMPHQYSPPQVSYPPQRKSMVPLWIIGIVLLLLGGIGVLWLLSRSLRKNPADTQSSSSGTVTNKAGQSNPACGHTLGKALYEKWIQMGGESGRLGCPIASEVEAPVSPQRTLGRWVQFASGDGGYLIQHESGPYLGKVFEVTGCMFKLYASQGGTSSWLGLPVGDEFETAQGARQEFEGGYVVWDSKTYQCQAHKH